MESVIAGFAAATGKTTEEGVKQMTKSACRRLASTVHPMGLGGGGKMDKFVKSIGGQVNAAWFGTNIGAYPATSSMTEAHRNARSPTSGRVPFRRFRKEKGKPWLDLISQSEKAAYAKKAQAKAFQAKAAWVKCADSLGGEKMSKVSALIWRHVANALGTVNVVGEGINTRVKFSNDVPYIKKIQYTEDIQKSIQEGMVNGLKYMETTTKKAIEKANRDLKS